MLRSLLRSKIHKATVTASNLEYEGSLTIDKDLMDLAGFAINEKVIVSNINNGERLETYVIPGPRGSGEICLNGAAARKGMIGDKIIIFSFCLLTEAEIASGHTPTVIVLDDKNKPAAVHQ